MPVHLTGVRMKMIISDGDANPDFIRRRVAVENITTHYKAESWKICGWLKVLKEDRKLGRDADLTAKKAVDAFLKSDLCNKEYELVLQIIDPYEPKHPVIKKIERAKYEKRQNTFFQIVSELADFCYTYQNEPKPPAKKLAKHLKKLDAFIGGDAIDEDDIDYEGVSLIRWEGDKWVFMPDLSRGFTTPRVGQRFKEDLKLLYEWHDWLKEARKMNPETAVLDPMFISFCNAFKTTCFCSGHFNHCIVENMSVPGGNLHAAAAYSDLDFVKNWFHKIFWRFGRYEGSAKHAIQDGTLLLFLNRLKEFADAYPEVPEMKQLASPYDMASWSGKKREAYENMLRSDARVKKLLEEDG